MFNAKAKVVKVGTGWQIVAETKEAESFVKKLYGGDDVLVVYEDKPIEDLIKRIKKISPSKGISLSVCGNGNILRFWDKNKVTPPAIHVETDILRNEIRNLNEGRNLKRYWTERIGTYSCDGNKFLIFPIGKWKEIKRHRCLCGKRHRVSWSDREMSAGCFDLCSFGWKHADLDPCGCTGIDEIISVEGKRVVVKVSGHKTVCDPTYEFPFELKKEDSSYSEVAHSIVCDAVGDGSWTGDDWCLSFTEEIKVVVSHKNGIIDYKKTAMRIIKAARKAIEPYGINWSEISESMSTLYDELYTKYDNDYNEL
jgi:hypothetical protein